MSDPGYTLPVELFAAMSAAVIKALPRDLDPDIARNWATKPGMLRQALADALCPQGPLPTAVLVPSPVMRVPSPGPSDDPESGSKATDRW